MKGILVGLLVLIVRFDGVVSVGEFCSTIDVHPPASLRESRIWDILTLRCRTEKGMIPRPEVPGQNTNIRELA